MHTLEYKNFKMHPVYTEFVFKDDFKMQFLSVDDKTDNPYNKVSLWGIDMLIESVEEIIAKKIYFRAHKGNARDLFDIAIAIHKDPVIFDKLIIPLAKIEELLQTINTIHIEEKLFHEYLYEINLMNPNPEYRNIADNTIEYLESFIESYIGAKKLGIVLETSELFEIEKYSYSEVIMKK